MNLLHTYKKELKIAREKKRRMLVAFDLDIKMGMYKFCNSLTVATVTNWYTCLKLGFVVIHNIMHYINKSPYSLLH